MARDGTNRGGRRIRAGDKPEPLVDKIAGGRTAHIMEFPMTELDGTDLVDAADLYGEEMPKLEKTVSACALIVGSMRILIVAVLDMMDNLLLVIVTRK